MADSDSDEQLNIIRTKEIIQELDEELIKEQKKKHTEKYIPYVEMKFNNNMTAKALIDTGNIGDPNH